MMMTRSRGATLLRTEQTDESTGIVEAIVNTFDAVDSYNTRFLYGAFDDIDADNNPDESTLPSVVWAHDMQRFVGKGVEFRQLKPGDSSLPERAKQYGGLYAKTAFALDTIDGGDLYKHVRFGSVKQWSFAFDPIEERNGDDGVVEYKRVITYEVSPVLVGANQFTSTITARSYERMTLSEKMQAVDTLLATLDSHMRAHVAMRIKQGRAIDAAFISELERMAVRTNRLHTDVAGDARRKAARREIAALKSQLMRGKQ